MAEYPSINDLDPDPDFEVSFEDSMDNIDQAPVMKGSELMPPSESNQNQPGTSGASTSAPSGKQTPSGSSGSGQSTSSSDQQTNPALLTKPRLQELVREIDPTEQLDEEVEEILLQIADDFVESAVNASCKLAKHRKASKVEVKDVQLYLERNWNMWVPGFGTDEVRPYKRAAVTESHKQRLALIRKAIKKY